MGELAITYTVIGEVADTNTIEYCDMTIGLEEAVSTWKAPLEKVFPSVSGATKAEPVEEKLFNTDNIYICNHKIAQPTVFIPVFPGTNCEFDSAKAFERAGAKTIVKVFKNLDAADIRDSVAEFEKTIAQCQMIMFPGGFSAGDEPDGSAKFFATAFQNAKLKEAVEKLLNERDGLVLGVCNGFQTLIKLGLVPYGKICGQTEASPTLTYNTIGRHISKMVGLVLGVCNGFQTLIKLGLVPYGKICGQTEASPTLTYNTIGRHISKMVYTKVVTNKSPWLQGADGLVPYGKICGQTEASPTLTYNTIGRHISKMVYTKVVTNKSPWLQGAELGGVYTNPASHGEGRFVASDEVLKELFANGQVATQYCDFDGNITMDEEWNPNGSYMAIEGITSPDGRVLGKMAHSERRGDSVAINIYGEQDMKIFESGVKYFK